MATGKQEGQEEKVPKTAYYCNHCNTFFDYKGKLDVVCPQCGVGVFTKNPMLTHPANKPMGVSKAREIISWLGWLGFKKAQPDFANDHPDLRPKKGEL